MKKLLQSLFILLFVATSAIAQNRTITGTVTSSEDGLPLPGASVKVKGTNIGVSTGANGKYSLSVPSSASALEFSSIGFTTQSITLGTSGVINVALTTDSKALQEVVIEGAYGTKTTSRSTTTNAQTVTGEKLNTVRGTNVNNALAGKVAGVQVRSQSAAALGRNTVVRLRGASGFGTGSNVLYVVDGTILPNADDLNLDDVEDVSVLQGPAAAAILGSQAAAGAILITTKKGKKNGGAGIALNIGASFENAYILPNYQNTYGGGNTADLIQYKWKSGDPVEWQALDGKYYHNYSDDSSWGPKMVGQEYIPWYAWYPGTQYSYKTASLTPQPNNAKDFFNTGVVLNNSVSFSDGGEKYNLRMTYGNQYTQGLLPNTSLNKNTFNFVANYDLNKHFTVGANINYVTTSTKGDINDDYSTGASTGSFSQWFHRDLDMDILKELRGLTVPGPSGTTIYASWNHNDPTSYNASNTKSFYAANYWYNPYTYYDLVDEVYRRDRLYGNISLAYKVNTDLKFTLNYRKQQNTIYTEDKFTSKFDQSGTQTSGNDARLKGYYATYTSFSNRENFELLGNYTKKISDFTLDVTAGVDLFNAVSKSNSASTVNGLSIPDLFTVGNSVDNPSVGNGRTAEKYRALLGRGSFGYKNFLFLDGSLRNDWFSTLPQSHNSVLSKSIGLSFVFSDLLPKEQFSWLSLGKLRASYGEIPQSIGVYTYPGFAYGVSSNKWSGNLLMQTPDSQVDPDVKGATSSNYEYGIDLGFFKNRLTLSATYWNAKEVDFPRSVTINGASGFTSIYTNIGRIDKSGAEFQITGTPIKSRNISWTISGTYANLLNNKVVEISDKYGVSRISLEGVWGTTMPYMIHQQNYQWGQIYGNGKKRDANGVPYVTTSGNFVNDPNVYFGSVLPKHTGGLQNSFNLFKDFEVNANIDYQVGGKFVSLSNMWGSYSGLTARTAALNDKGNPVRDAVANGGGVRVDGVDQTSGLPVTYYVEADTYYQNLYNNRTFDDYVYDLTFVKLREVSIGYHIPVKKFGLNKYIQNATFSIIARNPVLIYAKTKDFDPSEISTVDANGNVLSVGERAQLPGTRGFGFNLKIGF